MARESVLDRLRDAVQDYASEFHSEEGPVLLSEAVVIFEIVTMTDDGETGRCISYTIPTDNFSLSGALGLLEAGKHYIRRDILRDDDGD